jgi:hypothetical protein
MRGGSDEKSLALLHLGIRYPDQQATNRSALMMSFPSGEYRSKQSRHVRFFQRFCLDYYATLRLRKNNQGERPYGKNGYKTE